MSEQAVPGGWRDQAGILGRLAVILVALAALAALDICTIEVYLKPLAREHGIPWSRFEWEVLGLRTMAWHFFFVPATLVLSAIAGFAAARWRGALASALLFACGHEDVLYYVLLREPIPRELAWLDPNPAVAWTRFVLGTPHVTGGGLLLAAGVGLVGALALLRRPGRSG